MTQPHVACGALQGRAFSSLLFLASPRLTAADSSAAKSNNGAEETITVVVDGAQRSTTSGYQPLNSATTTLTSMPLLGIPQAVNTASDRVLEGQHATSLDEALYNVANVVQTNTLGSTQDAFTHRGFGANHDGSIMTNGLHTVLPRSFNATTERVEVLKGPASTLYGILDPGGLINVITRRPGRQFSGSVSATSTSFGGGTSSFDVTGPIEGANLAYRLIGEYQSEDYWRNFGKNKSSFIAPSLTWFGEWATVTASCSHRDYSAPFDRGTIFDLNTSHAVNVDHKTHFDETSNITDGYSNLVQLSAEYRLNDAWTACFDYSYSQDNHNDNQARVMVYDSATDNLTRRADGTHGSMQKMHSIFADPQDNVVVGGLHNELLIGIAYENYDLLRTNILRCKDMEGFNIYHPVHGTLDTYNTVSASDNGQRIQQESYAAYIQDVLYLTDNWIAVAGVRYQYYTQYAGKGRPFSVNTDSRDEKWTPKAGLVYKVTPNISLFANVAQSFMPRSSIANYIGELPSEEPTSYEVDAKFDLLNGITANIALFDIHKRNVLYTESIGDETVAKTAGKVRSQDVEVDLAGPITDNLSVVASYGYTDAKALENPDCVGKPLPNAPKHNGSLFLTYDIHDVCSSSALTVDGGGHAASKRSGTNGVDYYLQGYAVTDVFAAYKMKSQYPVMLQVNVKNLFDKTYYISSIGTNNLGDQIGDPREVQFTVKMDF